MGIFKKLLTKIGDALGFYRPSRPEDIPRKLSEEALARALSEAKLLHTNHHISVSDLAPGELPGLPKRADLP